MDTKFSLNASLKSEGKKKSKHLEILRRLLESLNKYRKDTIIKLVN